MSINTQISSIPGNKSRKVDHAEHDHISNLPDCIISLILSCLPMQDAVRTSVLSKDWEYKWTSRHEILLTDYRILRDETKKANFVNFVERALSLSHNPQNVLLECQNKYDLHRLRTWISVLLSRDNHCLQIIYREANIDLPISLLNRHSLRKLELVMPCTFKVPTAICFPYLTILKLKRVKILNELSNSNPVKFNFPVLVTFELKRCIWLNVKFVEIYAPKMTSFSSETQYNIGVNDYLIKITGDNLVQFQSCGVIPENITLSSGSKVVYADLRNTWERNSLRILELSGLRFRKLLKGLPCLKELELSDFVGEAISQSRQGDSLPKYYKMERLVLSCSNIKALLELLHAMPFLKILDIKVSGWKDLDYDVEEYVPACIVSRLEIVEFRCSAKEIPELFKVAKFFLKNANQLKKVIFSVWNLPRFPSLKNEITEELSTYLKASTFLTIVGSRAILTPSFHALSSRTFATCGS